jgi:hypothetical protein
VVGPGGWVLGAGRKEIRVPVFQFPFSSFQFRACNFQFSFSIHSPATAPRLSLGAVSEVESAGSGHVFEFRIFASGSFQFPFSSFRSCEFPFSSFRSCEFPFSNFQFLISVCVAKLRVRS